MDKITFNSNDEMMDANIDTLIHFANQEKIKFHPNIKLPKLQLRIAEYLDFGGITFVKMKRIDGVICDVHPDEVANYKMGNFREI